MDDFALQPPRRRPSACRAPRRQILVGAGPLGGAQSSVTSVEKPRRAGPARGITGRKSARRFLDGVRCGGRGHAIPAGPGTNRSTGTRAHGRDPAPASATHHDRRRWLLLLAVAQQGRVTRGDLKPRAILTPTTRFRGRKGQHHEADPAIRSRARRDTARSANLIAENNPYAVPANVRCRPSKRSREQLKPRRRDLRLAAQAGGQAEGTGNFIDSVKNLAQVCNEQMTISDKQQSYYWTILVPT